MTLTRRALDVVVTIREIIATPNSVGLTQNMTVLYRRTEIISAADHQNI